MILLSDTEREAIGLDASGGVRVHHSRDRERAIAKAQAELTARATLDRVEKFMIPVVGQYNTPIDKDRDLRMIQIPYKHWQQLRKQIEKKEIEQ